MDVKYNLKKLATTSNIYFNPNNRSELDDIKRLIMSDDKFRFADASNVNDTFNNLIKYIYTLLDKTDFFCKGLNLGYIQSSFYKANIIMALSSSGRDLLPNGNIFGFALIKINDEEKTIYIDIICSHVGLKYAGEILINNIFYLCHMLSFRKIKLNSLSTAVSFYERYGFQKIGLCEDEENLCEMEKIIEINSLGGRRRKRLTKNRKSRKTKKTKKSRKSRKSKKSRK